MNRSCLVCRENELELLLDLAAQPISNRFPERTEDDFERHRLQFGCCRCCGVAQLIDPPPPALIRPRVDWIRYNEPESHLDDFVDWLTQLPDIHQDSRFLGLTYKEDSTLDRLRDRGYRNCHRLDPADDWGVSDPSSGLETYQERLTPAWVADSARYQQADVVIARHVLEHAQDPRTAAMALSDLVQPGGYLAVEVPDNSRIFANREVCFLWEEHVLYFTPATLDRALRRFGLAVIWSHSYEYTIENALVCVARVEAKKTPVVHDPAASTAFKEAASLVSDFATERQLVQQTLARLARDKGPIAVFGAGHLAGKFINFYDVAASVEFVADDHPHKQHTLMPGSRLPIRPGSHLVESGVGLVLLSVNPDSEAKIIRKFGTDVDTRIEFGSIFRSSGRTFLNIS